jgi:toxin ParE1/3/4
MTPAELHPDAAEEAREAAAYYEEIRLGLGAEFQAELDAALARIRDDPLLYAAESGEIRICPLQPFPYSIFYEDLADRFWIAAIGHHRRRPAYWAHRRPG